VNTVPTTSYTGADTAADPQWRVYVSNGTCTPAPGPATVFDPNTLPPQPPCTAPTMIDTFDTEPLGAGFVSLTWQAVTGATYYRISRLDNGTWVTVTTVASTSYSGADTAADPSWRVYVATGSCSPTPGPATVFDPSTVPAP
jgi:hypothetical protein